MNSRATRSAIMSAFNDDILTTPYGHGELVTLPLHYYDDDRVSVFVEEYENGVRVSDRGMSLMRLHMAGLNLDASKVDEAWNRSVASVRKRELVGEDGVISAFAKPSDIGRAILDVAEASLRVDQLRWMASEPRRGRFSDQVVRRVTEIVGGRATVTPNAALRLTSGRTRQVTAAVGEAAESRFYLQAVGGSDRASREKSIEHCHFLFSLGAVERERKLAVVADGGREWDATVRQELGRVGQVAFYHDENALKEVVSKALAGV
ncbi:MULTISPECIES: DUF1828 domain-containing protein [Amycolatopsis]|uniref:DUF1828 domain-containing protein n=1 Tax=Amycolatopsis TaxID=1813 RepID=UPI000B8ABFC7|nr:MULTISPECIES: DUF1828 domain-containing protein [Amycolatopsis]OXM70722.1 hypothetical protein CF166_20500 [Amycolatopsis sp. KNN50.9b]